jgi:hypothetical protein
MIDRARVDEDLLPCCAVAATHPCVKGKLSCARGAVDAGYVGEQSRHKDRRHQAIVARVEIVSAALSAGSLDEANIIQQSRKLACHVLDGAQRLYAQKVLTAPLPLKITSMLSSNPAPGRNRIESTQMI